MAKLDTDKDEYIEHLEKLSNDNSNNNKSDNFVKPVVGKTENHKKYLKAIYEKSIVICAGPSGTAKTSLACGMAANLIKKENNGLDRIILTRPIVESGEKIGHLPGPQPLDAKIVTPKGWKSMGDLKINDEIICVDGTVGKILKIIPKGKKQIFKITTTDGTSTECCLDHLWYTETAENKKRNKSGSVKTTFEIFDTIRNKKGKINHFLPRNGPVQFEKQNLPLDPYTLGVLLGNGWFGNAIGFISIDTDLIRKVKLQIAKIGCKTTSDRPLSYNIVTKDLYNNKPAKPVKITNLETNEIKIYNSIGIALKEILINRSTLNRLCLKNIIRQGFKYEFLPKQINWSNPLKEIICNLGLLGRKAHRKFVPDIYKYSSIEDRIELIRGLMDTDGTIKKKNGESSFCTTSKNLALDLIEIVRSLGGRATLLSRNRINKVTNSKKLNKNIVTRKISYEFTISLPENLNPFYIKRKSVYYSQKYIHRVGISSIEQVGEKEVQCIVIDHPSHLYLTDNFIVTHNSAEEKIHPYLIPLLEEFKNYISNSQLKTWQNSTPKIIEAIPLAHCRGRNFHNSIIILDECQNASVEQLKLILTRLGRNSKIILNGDVDQSDLPRFAQGGLAFLMDRLKYMDEVAICEMTNEDIVRNPLIGKILDRLK